MSFNANYIVNFSYLVTIAANRVMNKFMESIAKK